MFDLGPTGLTSAQPAEPGPATEALGRRGPSPFQVLYRTSSMDAAARWLADHDVPPPARGIRNTGEQAMLVGAGAGVRRVHRLRRTGVNLSRETATEQGVFAGRDAIIRREVTR